MKSRGHTVKTVAGVVALLLGLGCLNYTTDAGIERHRTWAERAGFPPPSAVFFSCSVALACMGSGWTDRVFRGGRRDARAKRSGMAFS